MSTVYDLGPFRLDAETGVLSHSGASVPLGERAVAVLRVLVEHANEYVAKGTIIDAAWPGVVVEEGNLAVQVSAIRRVLSEVPGGERWIETLARRGYRFVGPVTAIRDDKKLSGHIQRSNVPQQLMSFVGRERELVEIKRLLPGKRLVTLVGIGGIGKTRLALQVAAEVVDAYRDGAWLVEFGAITDPSLAPITIARVLGIAERASRSLSQTLCDQLATRELLLVLDNCEHLRDACATLADALLRRASHLTIVATSREPLRVAGEQIYPLQPLSLPDPLRPDTIIASEAVQLFVERAQRQQPGFDLTVAHAPHVAQLCIHLDGIPLALELAAARVRSLSVEQILARIGDRFRLLTAGSRIALPHQQTLRATFDWSFDFLAQDERTVLRRLAIFAGGFTLEAASAAASDHEIDDYAVIDVLSRLVDRSLVSAETEVAGTRYRLLETTRAYALEKLSEVDEFAALALRHAQHFRDRFERAAADWMRMADAEWRALYGSELDNVRAALDWAFGAAGDAAIGIALAASSGPLWAELSLVREGRQRLEAALARVGARTSVSDQARLARALGSLWEAAPPQALPAWERAVDLYRRLDDTEGLGASLSQQAAALTYMDRFDEAAPLFAGAFPLLQRAAIPKALADYFLHLGALKMLTGDPGSARTHYERALSLYRGVGAERMALVALMYLADLTWAEGDLQGALAAFRETVTLARKSPLRRLALGYCLTQMAALHSERGELEAARAAASEGVPMLHEAGQIWLLADHIALLAARGGRTAIAARLAGYADAAHAAKGSRRQVNEARARDQLQELLQQSLGAGELERLVAEGATMSEDTACSLALEA